MTGEAAEKIRVVRVYDAPKSSGGCRVLVDRLWPRGVKKEEIQVDHWAKELAPSAELRRWFGHDPDRWPEFRRRYFAELDSRPGAWQKLIHECGRRRLTLLYAAKDEEHNNAVALREYLEDKLHRGAGKKKGKRQ